MKKEYYYGILPLALTSCLVSQTSAQERQINRPNVVFIYADDIGYGDLSCNGAKTIHTPNVERLAKMGVRFTNAHSAAATSTPSRYAMLGVRKERELQTEMPHLSSVRNVIQWRICSKRQDIVRGW